MSVLTLQSAFLKAGPVQEGHCSPPTGASHLVPSCQREYGTMATFHPSLSKLLRCQQLPEAPCVAQTLPSLL